MSVETIGRGGEIALCILAKLENMVNPGKVRFEVAQHGVEPAELRQLPWFAATDDDHRMRASRIGDAVESMEAIRQDLTSCIERAARPVFYGGTGKSLNRGKSRVDGMSLQINRDGRDKGHFVLEAPSTLAAGVCFTQIGIICLHCAPAKRRSPRVRPWPASAYGGGSRPWGS